MCVFEGVIKLDLAVSALVVLATEDSVVVADATELDSVNLFWP